ncbi:MAG: hypothetical protein GC199_06635 [Alphaproteobacteria bacterium]|nr:hypothetical protein [Alphaproteobacteria bacterium]
MIPKGQEGIGHIAQRIFQHTLANITDSYTASDVTFIAILTMMIGQEFDRAAETLEADHRDMRALFEKARGLIGDVPLKAQMAGALAVAAPSLRIQDLSARNDEVMRVLIALHAAVEDAEAFGAPWARDLNAEIWRFLERYVNRRTYEVPM